MNKCELKIKNENQRKTHLILYKSQKEKIMYDVLK